MDKKERNEGINYIVSSAKYWSVRNSHHIILRPEDIEIAKKIVK